MAPAGLVVLLPGASNLTGEFAGLRDLIEAAYPAWQIDLRRWGPPLLSLHNLVAYERNVKTARERAAELAEYRRKHPDVRITIVGYSGGGGMAVLIVAALPAGVRIDRLILIAPAISPDYPLAERVLPHVREFVVNYASARDLQVGWGTNQFGTIDRVECYSAGYGGFRVDDPKRVRSRVVQVHWDKSMQRDGHLGNHLGYLVPQWQKRYLMPALDPEIDADDLDQRVQSAAQTEIGRAIARQRPALATASCNYPTYVTGREMHAARVIADPVRRAIPNP